MSDKNYPGQMTPDLNADKSSQKSESSWLETVADFCPDFIVDGVTEATSKIVSGVGAVVDFASSVIADDEDKEAGEDIPVSSDETIAEAETIAEDNDSASPLNILVDKAGIDKCDLTSELIDAVIVDPVTKGAAEVLKEPSGTVLDAAMDAAGEAVGAIGSVISKIIPD